MTETNSIEPRFAEPYQIGSRRNIVPGVLHRNSRMRQSLQVAGLGVLVAFGTIALLMAVSWIRSQAAVAVVKTHLEDIRGGKIEEAYNLFSKDYRSTISLPSFRRFVRRESRLRKYQSMDFWGRSALGQTAVLWGSMEDQLGRSSPIRYQLVKEEGAWRIDGFRISTELADPNPEPVRFTNI